MSEVDPNGKAANESGSKLDAGKNRLSLVLFGFSRALKAVGEVGTYGANKYTDNGWMEVPDGERRYSDAMLRHLLQEASGERCDQDTGLLHAAHAAWNALARLDLMIRDAETAQRKMVDEILVETFAPLEDIGYVIVKGEVWNIAPAPHQAAITGHPHRPYTAVVSEIVRDEVQA